MWKSLLWSLVSSWVLPELVKILKEEAKKTDNPIDDQMVGWVENNQAYLTAALKAAF